MFTGLVAATGKVESVTRGQGTTRIRIAAPTIASRLATGDSVAVSGVCLTALDITPTHFEADLAQETIARTSLSRLQPGSVVNLELPTPAGTPLGGHIVQGHVDATGTLRSLTAVTAGAPEHTDWLLRVVAPPPLARYIVEKGSITIEGISLTVAAAQAQADGSVEVTVAIIPHTYAATNLHTLEPGFEVNLETDVLAKYAEQHLHAQHRPHSEAPVTELSLIAEGF